MIEIIIFYLLFRTTLIVGFVLGYLVRGLLQLHYETKLKEQKKEDNTASDKFTKLLQDMNYNVNKGYDCEICRDVYSEGGYLIYGYNVCTKPECVRELIMREAGQLN